MRRYSTTVVLPRLWDIDLPDKLRALSPIPMTFTRYVLHNAHTQTAEHQFLDHARTALPSNAEAPYTGIHGVFAAPATLLSAGSRLEIRVWVYRRPTKSRQSHVVISGEDRGDVVRLQRSILDFLEQVAPGSALEALPIEAPTMARPVAVARPAARSRDWRSYLPDFVVQYGAALAAAGTIALVGLIYALAR